MLISHAEAILLQIPFENKSPQPALYGRTWKTFDTLLLRIETDTGVIGWGEAFVFHAGVVTKNALENLVIPNLLGRDPSQIVPLMNDLQRRLHLYGRTGPVACALSAVDIALWDINGKLAGMPLFRMLGGSTRTHLPAYASILRTADVNGIGPETWIPIR
jgi:D-galactarolactone cycloisomerase